MKISRNLYMGDKACADKKDIVKSLKKRIPLPGIYAVALPMGENDLLEIYSAVELAQKYYHKTGLKIIGIAEGYDEALQLVSTIIGEIYTKTGGFDTRAYLE